MLVWFSGSRGIVNRIEKGGTKKEKRPSFASLGNREAREKKERNGIEMERRWKVWGFYQSEIFLARKVFTVLNSRSFLHSSAALFTT